MRLGGLTVDGVLRGTDLALALVGRALICSFVSCREASSDSSGQPHWPAAINLLGARHVVSLTAGILAGLAMPGNRPTHSRRAAVPERQSIPYSLGMR
jgi:hypothetical protein